MKEDNKWEKALLNKEAIKCNRPHLYKEIGENKCYVLKGGLDKKDEALVVIIPDSDRGTLTIVEDVPDKKSNSCYMMDFKGHYYTIKLDARAFRMLLDIVVEKSGLKLVSGRNKGGRPAKYTLDDARDIMALQQQGKSIREIAKEKSMSTTTVQNLLKRYENVLIVERISQG